jgi:hypothetical protein
MHKMYVLVILTFLLSACATIDPTIKYYTPPPETTAENGATIAGSRVPQSFPYVDQTVYLLGISGQPVRGGEKSYADPIVLAAGVHRIAIAWVQGHLSGSTTLELTVGSGDRVVIRHQRVESRVARIWIEGSKTGEAITEPVFIYLNVASPGGFIPIFIPRGR